MSRGKIAIFHNLKDGGAKRYIIEITKCLFKFGYSIDLYTLDPDAKPSKYYNLCSFPHAESPRLFSFLANYKNYLKKIKLIAAEIEKNKYDQILITHCYISQTPPIFELLTDQETIKKTIYIFHELKREFYEKTSTDHHSLKRTLARTVRIFLKYKEIKNIKLANSIVTNSFYSKNMLLKRTGKESIVITPLTVTNKYSRVKNKDNFFSTVVTGGYTKGIDKLRDLFHKNSHGWLIKYVGALGNDNENENFLGKTSNLEYKILLKKTKYYIANNYNEPLGLATIDAMVSQDIVFALNSGSHNELIKSGINGFLYPKVRLSELEKIVTQNIECKLLKYPMYKYDWEKISRLILTLCKK